MKNKINKQRKELKYYGLHACLSLWEKRPQDIIRVYLDQSNVNTFTPLLKWCAQQKKAYHIIPDAELDKVSDSVHHEGVCILARELPFLTPDELMTSLGKGNQKVCLLYLDGVQNPHNLGSIMRSCAHFGIPYILGEEGKLPALSPSACRIAKGGAEIVRLVLLSKPIQTLDQLKKRGFSFIGTSSHGGVSLYQFSFPSKSILAIGSEAHGVSNTFLKMAMSKIQIPGSGLVESLNVSVATSLCMGEYFRQHMAKP